MCVLLPLVHTCQGYTVFVIHSRHATMNFACSSTLSHHETNNTSLLFFACLHFQININILNSCPTQGRDEGWDAMKPLYYRSVSSKGAGRPSLTHHRNVWWNETKWMRWVWRNGGMKFVVGENGRNPEKNLPRLWFVHHETHMEGPRRELGTPAVGGERLTACATRPPPFPNAGRKHFTLRSPPEQ